MRQVDKAPLTKIKETLREKIPKIFNFKKTDDEKFPFEKNKLDSPKGIDELITYYRDSQKLIEDIMKICNLSMEKKGKNYMVSLSKQSGRPKKVVECKKEQTEKKEEAVVDNSILGDIFSYVEDKPKSSE